MKAKVFWIFLTVITFAVSASAADKIEGNGTIVTKVFTVDEYTRIHVGQNIEYNRRLRNFYRKDSKRYPTFTYHQTPGEVFLEITMDENLFPFLSVEVKDQGLYIKTLQDYKVSPTRLSIEGKSSQLKKVDICGNMDFVSPSALSLDTASFNVSGVGDIKISFISCDVLSCDVSGVGKLYLAGNVNKGRYNVSGVGKVFAYDCEVKELRCEVSGVGKMEVAASEKLTAETSGVGGIRYKGNAETNLRKSGIGGIKRVY